MALLRKGTRDGGYEILISHSVEHNFFHCNCLAAWVLFKKYILLFFHSRESHGLYAPAASSRFLRVKWRCTTGVDLDMYVPRISSWELSCKCMCPVAAVKSSVSKSSNAFVASHRRTVLSMEPRSAWGDPHVIGHDWGKWFQTEFDSGHTPEARISPSLLNFRV